MQGKRLSLNNALLLFDKEKKRVQILSYLKSYTTPIVPYPEIPTTIMAIATLFQFISEISPSLAPSIAVSSALINLPTAWS